jgi:hypothetical protein
VLYMSDVSSIGVLYIFRGSKFSWSVIYVPV